MNVQLGRLGLVMACALGMSLLPSGHVSGQNHSVTLPDGTTLRVTTTVNDFRPLTEILTGQRIDFAALALGASVISVSSALAGQGPAPADPRDVLGGDFSRYFSGEVGNFIFGVGDPDQFVVVDLGQRRGIDQVGADFSDLTSDREVFDFFEVLISEDNRTFTSVGRLGLRGTGDALDFSLDAPIFFTFDRLVNVRYVRYNFGRFSPDHGGGSRVLKVYATSVRPPGRRFSARLSCPATARANAPLTVGVVLGNPTGELVTVTRGALGIHAGELRLTGPQAFGISVAVPPATSVRAEVPVLLPRAVRPGSFVSLGFNFFGRVAATASRKLASDGCVIEVVR